VPKDRKEHSSSQNWATFLKNQAGDTWASDFTVVNDWLFRQWDVFVVMELKTRRRVHTGVTKYPTDERTAQQLRESTPWGKGSKYLIRDRDKKICDTLFSSSRKYQGSGDAVSNARGEWGLRKVHGQSAARMSGAYPDP